MYHLNQLFKGMNRVPGREPTPKYPLRNYDLIIMINFWPSNSYTHILNKATMCIQKGFSLRVGEFLSKTKRPSIRTLKWKHVNLYIKNKIQFAEIALRNGSKTNHTFKIEILNRKCQCYTRYAKLCPVHWFHILKFAQKKRFNAINDNSYVFVDKNNNLFLSNDWNNTLKKAIVYRGYNIDSGNFGTHSLRHGDLTDLLSAGVPRWLVKRHARHSPNANSTDIYTHTSAEEEALLTAKYTEKFFC